MAEAQMTETEDGRHIVAVLWRVLVVDNPIDKKSRR